MLAYVAILNVFIYKKEGTFNTITYQAHLHSISMK